MKTPSKTLQNLSKETFSLVDQSLQQYTTQPAVREIGWIRSVSSAVAQVEGLPGVEAEELVQFTGGYFGLVFNVDISELGVVLLDHSPTLKAGTEVRRTGKVLEVPVGKALLGRVVDPLGRPLDEKGDIHTSEYRAMEQPAPSIIQRAPVTVPLQTGIKVIDALIPIGRGQRELILGDRQTGKTALALDTIIHQRDRNVICIYCAIGQQHSAVSRLLRDLQKHEAMAYSIVVVAGGEDQPGLQFIAPYAATAMAEYFMLQGQDTLIVFDDLTRHARAYRELSLLLRRPPGREAFPGDIFYIHSRLLERSTHLQKELGGGSLTALPIIETEGQNISAFIPTNLISITDGQIYLSPDLFQKGILPPIDVGKSVSRVGGKTQLPAYRTITGDLRLSYSQFEELETFARFGTRLDDETRKTIDHGRRVREILKQPQYQPLRVPEQIASLMAVKHGFLDQYPLSSIPQAEYLMHQIIRERASDLCEKITLGQQLTDAEYDTLGNILQEALKTLTTQEAHGFD
ncbi:MAG: alternate F1F0 ATPase, F1 subunit alpha [Nitrospirota bacterium]|nr:alternate F1F0 ATPase, F1 subunit alpha [Nitrospirota bacterium]